MERQNSIVKKITNIFSLILRLFCKKKKQKIKEIDVSDKL